MGYLAGCDGARSTVREALGTGFPGGTYRQIFYVADVDASGPPLNGELHVDLDEADFLAVFPLAGVGRARLIGAVRDERADRAETLKFEDVSDRAIQHLKLQVNKVNWFSTYHVHHRVTEHFRKGRAFLLGDAAHIHSPAGGQGMNTGIGDAINLAWKLAAVLQGRAPDSLLDSYEAERIGFARRLVATTTIVIHIGDGCAVAKEAESGAWQALTWPAHGEYASTTFFVTDEEPRISIQRRNTPISALVAFTDGLERLALDFGAAAPHTRFFEGVLAPICQSSVTGRDAKLSHQLARYLDSPTINARTDDDKTLLIAALR